MQIERASETLRLRLLRLVAGLFAVVAFVSVGPFSRAVSRWTFGHVSSVLSRAEAAAQCLVIVQARMIAGETGRDIDPEQLFDACIRESAEHDSENCRRNLRDRLEAIQALLEDLPRFGLRLLRRTERRLRRIERTTRADRVEPSSNGSTFKPLCAWRLADLQIERPPDKDSCIP